MQRNAVFGAITPKPKHCAMCWLLLCQPKTQRLPQCFCARQPSLLTERIQLGALKIRQIHNGAHDDVF